jgi:hypothetical protein
MIFIKLEDLFSDKWSIKISLFLSFLNKYFHGVYPIFLRGNNANDGAIGGAVSLNLN